MLPLKRREILDSEIVSVDDELKVKLPSSLCESAGIIAGTEFLITVNLSTGEITMNIISKPGFKLAEIQMEIRNIPGAMAIVTKEISEKNINIITLMFPPSTSETIKGSMVLEISKSSITVGELEKAFKALDAVKSVMIRSV